VGARRSDPPDVVKQQVAAHWNRRAPGFDEDFGHSIRTPAERAAWNRILDLVLPARGKLEALDAGCGTGFLTFELAGAAQGRGACDGGPAGRGRRGAAAVRGR
jgi:2-polyprenyl-3-methyl-5-hydroxy-6-metoxy-1,4-benzoquinol methylase